LQLRATFNGVSRLYQDSWNKDILYYIKTKCSRCGLNPAKDPTVDPWIAVPLVAGLSHGEHGHLVNFVHKCINCSGEMTIRVLHETMRPYIGLDINTTANPDLYFHGRNARYGEG